MKRCLQCENLFSSSGWKCQHCSYEPPIVDEIPVFASYIQGANESYDPNWYQQLVKLEAANFWFLSRNRLIQWFAEKYAPSTGKYLELGCGSGFVLQMLQSVFPAWRMTATDAQIDGLRFAATRVPKAVAFAQVDATAIPFRDEFEVVGAFDVVEHIENDSKVLSEIFVSLKAGGTFLVSVPQHMFLWSQFDEIGCHFRRYSRNQLESKLVATGFEVLDSTSFNSLLLPVMYLSRLLKKSAAKKVDVMAEFEMSNGLNKVLNFVLKVEYWFIKLGVRWPAGGSRIIVARKPTH